MGVTILLTIASSFIVGLGYYFCAQKTERGLWTVPVIAVLLWGFLLQNEGLSNPNMILQYRLSFLMVALSVTSFLFFLYQFPKKEKMPNVLKIALIVFPLFVLGTVNNASLLKEVLRTPSRELIYGVAYIPFSMTVLLVLSLGFLRLKKLEKKYKGFDKVKIKSLLQVLYFITATFLITGVCLPLLGINHLTQTGGLLLLPVMIIVYLPFIRYKRSHALMGLQKGLSFLVSGAFVGTIIFLTVTLRDFYALEKGGLASMAVYFLMSISIVASQPLLARWSETLSKKLLFKSRVSSETTLRNLLKILGTVKTKEKLVNTLLWSIPLVMTKAQLWISLKDNDEREEFFSTVEDWSIRKVENKAVFEKLHREKSMISIGDISLEIQFAHSAEDYHRNLKIYEYMTHYNADLIFPIILSGSVNGYVLLKKDSRLSIYHEDEAQYLEIIINHFSTALDNILYLEQLEKNTQSFLNLNTFMQRIMSNFELREVAKQSDRLFQMISAARKSYLFMPKDEEAGFSLISEKETGPKKELRVSEDFFNVAKKGERFTQYPNSEKRKELSCLLSKKASETLWVYPLYNGKKCIAGLVVVLDETEEDFSITEGVIIENGLRLIEASINRIKLYKKTLRAKAFNEEILKNMVAGIIVCDSKRIIRSFNRQSELMTGLSSEAVLGKDFAILSTHIPEFSEFNRVLKTKEKRDLEMALMTDGEIRCYSVQLGPISLASYSGAIAIITNLSPLKLLQKEVAQAEDLGAVGMMAAGIAHEIKNPLVAIKTFSQLLPQKWEEEAFRNKYANLVIPQLDRIDNLCRSLRILGETKKKTLSYVHVSQLLSASVEMIQESGAYKHIQMTMNADIEACIFVDKEELSQVLFNLIQNAVEAIGEKEGRLTVSAGINERDRVEITVSDTGSGMTKESKAKLFDPFYSSKEKGTGLGMTIVHRIVLEHNGDIFVETEEGKGTSVTVAFPVAEPKKVGVLS